MTVSTDTLLELFLATFSGDITKMNEFYIRVIRELPSKEKRSKVLVYRNIVRNLVEVAGYEPSFNGFKKVDVGPSNAQPYALSSDVLTDVEAIMSKELFDMPSHKAKEHPYKDILDRGQIKKQLTRIIDEEIGKEIEKLRDRYQYKGDIVDVMETLKMMLRAFHNNNPVSDKDLEAEALGWYQSLYCMKRKLYDKSAYRPIWVNYYTTKQKVGKSYHCKMIASLVDPFSYKTAKGLDSLKDAFDKSGGRYYIITVEELSGSRADIALLKAKVTDEFVNMRNMHVQDITNDKQIATYQSNSNNPISTAIGTDSENTRFLEIAWGTEKVNKVIDKWVAEGLYEKLFCSINENIDVEPIERPENEELADYLFNEVMSKQIEKHPVIETFMEWGLEPGEHLVKRKIFNGAVNKSINEHKSNKDDYGAKFIKDKLTAYFEGNQSFYKRKKDGEYFCFNKKFDPVSLKPIENSAEKTLD